MNLVAVVVRGGVNNNGKKQVILYEASELFNKKISGDLFIFSSSFFDAIYCPLLYRYRYGTLELYSQKMKMTTTTTTKTKPTPPPPITNHHFSIFNQQNSK